MKTEEIVDAARNAGFSSSEIMHRLAAFKRLIQYSTSAEREKCTGTQEFVTLPREVVERALAALDAEDPYRAAVALRAALDQPQNHVFDAGNMAPAGWRLVPVEPTRDMLTNWIKADVVSNRTAPDLYRAMLDAAPSAPAENNLTCSFSPDLQKCGAPAAIELADDQIDAIADAMPGGLEGFMKGWGWRQFARAVLEATHNIK